MVEDLARERAKELFGAKFANVQPHSGANANLAAYFALHQGRYCAGYELDNGGHLMHGSPVNFGQALAMGMMKPSIIDFDRRGASAYPDG